MHKRKEILGEFVHKSILEGAVKVLQDKGMEGFTISNVAIAAGIAKGTTYLYFKNKKELLDGVVEFAFNDLEGEYLSISSSDNQPGVKLRLYALASMKHIEKHQALFMALSSNMFNTWDRYLTDHQSWYWKTVDLIASTLNEAITIGEIKEVNSLKIAALYLNSICMLMSHRIFSTEPESVEDDISDLLDLYFDGLATNDNSSDFSSILQ